MAFLLDRDEPGDTLTSMENAFINAFIKILNEKISENEEKKGETIDEDDFYEGRSIVSEDNSVNSTLKSTKETNCEDDGSNNLLSPIPSNNLTPDIPSSPGCPAPLTPPISSLSTGGSETEVTKLLCLKLVIETDHQPLEIIYKKPISTAPPRLKRIIFEIKQYGPTIQYVKGTTLKIADTLNRDCMAETTDEKEELEVQIIIPMSDSAFQELNTLTKEDEEFQELTKLVQNGWPKNVNEIKKTVHHYWNYREEIAQYEGIFCKGERVMLPKKMQH
ncbi:hypothetical protein CBL_20806 [Carabus blaptoides fortunei]